jgi:hypothetical protein
MNPLQRSDQMCNRRIGALCQPAVTCLCEVGKFLAELTRFAVLAAAVVGGGVIAGCTIPSDCGDLDYPTYGGAWQRTRRDSGRVGSVFDPAGARTATLSPRELPETDGQTRSSRDSILSSPPDTIQSPADATHAEDDPLRQPSPSDRPDSDKLRELQLEDINIQRGTPAPPDLN